MATTLSERADVLRAEKPGEASPAFPTVRRRILLVLLIAAGIALAVFAVWAIVSDAGLSISNLHTYIAEHGGVKGYPEGTYVEDGASVLEHDCEILIPAALA